MASRLKGRFIKTGEKKRREDSRRRMFAVKSGRNIDFHDPKETVPNISSMWMEGERRIIEPSPLTRELMKGCDWCGKRLDFTEIVEETQSGLGSFLYILCNCGELNKVSTGKVHYDKEKRRTRPIFDINTKTAIAMYDTGMGLYQVNRFLTNLNLPGISQPAMKKREQEITESIKKVTRKSLDDSLEEEKNASLRQSPVSEDEKVAVAIKYDMGWQKRGNGRKYDSKSAVGCAFGHLTGKLVDVDIRSTDCRVCAYWEGKSETTPNHKCAKNWFGSSKAMEPDVGVSLIKNIEEKGCTVKHIIMDDDTTTMHRIQREIDHDVDKWSDMFHLKSRFGQKLYKLREKYPKDISQDDIKHIQSCFMYAIKGNKNNEHAIKEGIAAVIPHVYNAHDLCNKK